MPRIKYRTCCTLISGSAGYKQARDILHTRFGNDHLISRKIVSDLTDGKPVSKSCDIRKLADDLGMACSTLNDLKTTYEIDNQNTIIQIAQRCPKSIQTKWKNKALDTKRETGLYPRFAEFVSFMRKIANDWCDPVYGGPTLSLPNVKSTSVNRLTVSRPSQVCQRPVNQSLNRPRIVLHVVKLTGWFIVMYSRLWSRLIDSNWSNRSDCVLPVSDQIMLLLNVNLLMYAQLQIVVNAIQSSTTPTSLRVQMGQVVFQLAVPLAHSRLQLCCVCVFVFSDSPILLLPKEGARCARSGVDPNTNTHTHTPKVRATVHWRY